MTAKLTQTMQDAIDSTPNEDGTRYARPATVKALVARGLVVQSGTSWFTLTEAGQAAQTQPEREVDSSAAQMVETVRGEDGFLQRVPDVDHRDGCECVDCEGFYADEAAEIEAANDADADAELLGFLGSVIEQAERELELPTTETDVRTPEGLALVTLVQSGSKLIWGKLIAVVNRRTRYCAPLLVTVEFPDGVRRLVSADDVLVSDTFAAA